MGGWAAARLGPFQAVVPALHQRANRHGCCAAPAATCLPLPRPSAAAERRPLTRPPRRARCCTLWLPWTGRRACRAPLGPPPTWPRSPLSTAPGKLTRACRQQSAAATVGGAEPAAAWHGLVVHVHARAAACAARIPPAPPPLPPSPRAVQALWHARPCVALLRLSYNSPAPPVPSCACPAGTLPRSALLRWSRA